MVVQAQEGVRVMVLIWDDRSSVKIGKTTVGGMLATHDEETELYFQDTGVLERFLMQVSVCIRTLAQ